jgi:hypothetical protein
VARLTGPDGLVWAKSGWSWGVLANDDHAAFMMSRDITPSSPAMQADAFVLHFDTAMGLAADGNTTVAAECDLFTGGLTFRFGHGRLADHTLDLIVWHSVLHETDDGDLAPGLGPLVVEDEEE